MHTAYDLTPLFRSTVGFDRISRMIDDAFKMDERAVSYPPYNIIKCNDDEYEITIAVAGFKQDELNITVQENQLTISGAQMQATEPDSLEYLHKGIAARSFNRSFNLADHVKVVDANLADGMLTLALKREVPEASKPRQITINNVTEAKKKLK